MRPRQIGRHFADIFANENVWYSIKISLQFVPKGPINKIQHWTTPNYFINQWWLVYWRIYASLGLNEQPLKSGTFIQNVFLIFYVVQYKRDMFVSNWSNAMDILSALQMSMS